MLQDERTDKPTEGWSLTYLPDIYQGVEHMGGFLRFFERIWESFDQQINHLDRYFDPYLTPARFLPWLGTWLGLALEEHLQEQQQRALLGKAMWLYERQGTAVALRERLRICVKAQQIDIQSPVENSQIAPDHFRVTVHMSDDAPTDPDERRRIEERVKRIVEAETPAYYNAPQIQTQWP